MSTRAQIHIEGSDVLVYKHSDGYPDGVLPTLVPFISTFYGNRGYDPDYFTARLAAALVAEHDDSLKAYGPQFTGVGVDTQIHSDVEFLYSVKRDGSIAILVPTPASSKALDVMGSNDIGAVMREMREIRHLKAPVRRKAL